MTMAAEPIPQPKNNQRKHMLLGLGILFIMIGIIWFIYWFLWAQYEEYTDDAYVGGNIVQLTSQISGTVAAIFGDDTALIKAGTKVIALDNSDYRLRFEQAQAELAKAVRQVKQLFQNDAQYQAELKLKEADLDKAEADLKRRQKLIKAGAVSTEELQHKKTAVSTARAALAEARYKYLANHALIANTRLENNPLILTAAANLRSAYFNYNRIMLLAPVTGYMAKRSVQLGQQIMPGTPLLAIVPLNQLWVEANFKESQLSSIRIGQPVTLISDLYGSKIKFHGKVIGLNAGTGSAFSLLPPQNATGNWIKIVQRVPVRISLNADELSKYPLRIGLSMRVTVATLDRNGSTLAHTTVTTPTYVSTVYANQFTNVYKAADLQIKQIIEENAIQPDTSRIKDLN